MDLAQIIAPLKPKLAVLFGSRASGKARKLSDWDIYVVSDEEGAEKLAREIERKHREMRLSIIVQSSRDLEAELSDPSPLLLEIARNGKAIVNREMWEKVKEKLLAKAMEKKLRYVRNVGWVP